MVQVLQFWAPWRASAAQRNTTLSLGDRIMYELISSPPQGGLMLRALSLNYTFKLFKLEEEDLLLGCFITQV